MKKMLFALALTAVGLSFVTQVSAETEVMRAQSVGTELKREVKADQLRANKESLEVKCDAIENRIDAHLTRFNANKTRHATQYQKLKEGFRELISTLSAKGYDVTSLQADAKVLDEKILKFATDYKAFADQLGKARLLSCGESEGAFKTEMQKARDLLSVVNQSSQDVRQYYQTVIKADVQALRQQKADRAAE
jgi:hypothetical protein